MDNNAIEKIIRSDPITRLPLDLKVAMISFDPQEEIIVQMCF